MSSGRSGAGFVLAILLLGALAWFGLRARLTGDPPPGPTLTIEERLAGGVVMQLYTIIQHAEMEENQPDLRKSTRSFRTHWFSRFLYANMHHHVEHHLYPTVPLHALPKLNAALAHHLPEPDRGLIRTNLEVLGAVLRRSLGRGRRLADA